MIKAKEPGHGRIRVEPIALDVQRLIGDGQMLEEVAETLFALAHCGGFPCHAQRTPQSRVRLISSPGHWSIGAPLEQIRSVGASSCMTSRHRRWSTPSACTNGGRAATVMDETQFRLGISSDNVEV